MNWCVRGAAGRARRTAGNEIEGPILVRPLRLDLVATDRQLDRPVRRIRPVAQAPLAHARPQLALERRPGEGPLDVVAGLVDMKRRIAGGAEEVLSDLPVPRERRRLRDNRRRCQDGHQHEHQTMHGDSFRERTECKTEPGKLQEDARLHRIRWAPPDAANRDGAPLIIWSHGSSLPLRNDGCHFHLEVSDAF